jgi:hypothetical protein
MSPRAFWKFWWCLISMPSVVLVTLSENWLVEFSVDVSESPRWTFCTPIRFSTPPTFDAQMRSDHWILTTWPHGVRQREDSLLANPLANWKNLLEIPSAWLRHAPRLRHPVDHATRHHQVAIESKFNAEYNWLSCLNYSKFCWYKHGYSSDIGIKSARAKKHNAQKTIDIRLSAR